MSQSGSELGGLNRRSLLKRALIFAGMSGIAGGLTAFGQAGAGARGAGRGAGPGAGTRGATQDSTGSSLILLGTQGGPNINLGRSEAASAIVVGGQPYLIDCGYGTLRALVEAGITLNSVTNVFITHLHDDHTADIPALLSHKWTGSTAGPRPTTVHGPYGTVAMVEGAMAFFKANIEIRTIDEGRTVKPETVFFGKDLAAPTITEVFRDERVTVRAIENDHFPDRAKAKMPYRSFAYRFNMADRSIVFSGDTPYSSRLVELARGADVLVCEVLNPANAQRGARAGAAAPANTAGESVARHVRETHSTPEEVGRMATEAKVKTVVLNHLVPGGTGQRGATDDSYTSGVREQFSGEVVLGRDQLRL